MTMETERGINKLAPNQQINGNSSRISSDGSSMPRSPRVEKSTKSMGDKRSDLDFIFGKLIGEGSFSSVYLAKDIHTNHEYAVKVCEKQLIIREKKVQQITREKDVMNLLNSNQNPKAPFFVKLSYAFQGEHKLYFVMTYCKNGELLNLIQRVGNFDRECARFYTAELVRALEHLHSLNIIHRDLKPENILLDEHMHIKITDFGCAKILTNEEIEAVDDGRGRKSSFVGTAQYVSPELLESKKCGRASDLWALGCILYQMIEWEFKSEPGLKPIELQLMLGLEPKDEKGKCKDEKTGDTEASKKSGKKNMADVSQEEFILRLAVQERENKWHKFVENNLILKQGLMDKRKGLFPRRRMFLLTTGPHLYYVDPANMVLKGQIPWCSTILPEAKNFKTFFVHTPNRTYYLEDPNGYALEWCKAIEEVKRFYYPENTT
ncbi:3-phosphoinositide-dependent protein kinase 2-like [Homarus americanus]|uniref:3-phosphoinositide-dependent protein kinase 1 n=1 Tax=Homarus americanus TaxID=6706 RepID=A0A8J5JY56_HOMAM|nr:3-phosphoinositide-dependent protein kinase 2-like [Homarus americanus]